MHITLWSSLHASSLPQDEFRAALEAYLSELSWAAFKLLEAFSLGLGLPAHALHPAFGVSRTDKQVDRSSFDAQRLWHAAGLSCAAPVVCYEWAERKLTTNPAARRWPAGPRAGDAHHPDAAELLPTCGPTRDRAGTERAHRRVGDRVGQQVVGSRCLL